MFQGGRTSDLQDLAAWEPYILHDLAHVFWVPFALCTDPAHYRITAGKGLDYRDRDVSDVYILHDLTHLSWVEEPAQHLITADLDDLDHVARWESYNLHDLAHVSWV